MVLKSIDVVVSGRGVSVAAGVVGESGFWESVGGCVVMKEASERECTLTSESEAEDAWSEEDLRCRCEGARWE